jgi:drug/metabolite transporter (DMT)-like permease
MADVAPQNKNWLLLGSVLAMITWGISWPSTKILSTYIQHPVQLASVRFVFNVASVFIILKIFKVPLAINKKGYSQIAKGTLLIAIYNYLFFNGIFLSKPGAAGILVTTITPIVTYALGAIISKRALSKAETVGLCLGFIAALILLHIWQGADVLLASGNLYLVLCTITWAFLSRNTSAAANYGHPLAYTFWIYFFCTILLGIYASIQFGFIETLQLCANKDFKFWGNMLFNAIINSGMATMFYFYATSQIGAERTSSFIYIVPFSAAISSYLILGEKLAWYTVLGGVVGLCAVAMLNYSKLKSKLK